MNEPTYRDPKRDHWHVLGAGAMGSLWAATLALSSRQVTLLGRNRHASEHVDSRETDGNSSYQAKNHPSLLSSAKLTLAKAFDDRHLPEPITVSYAAPELLSNDSISQLIIATKSTAVLAATEDVIDKLAKNAIVVCLANGMGYQEALIERIDASAKNIQLYWAATSDGAMLKRKSTNDKELVFDILHTGLGQTKVGTLLRRTVLKSQQNAGDASRKINPTNKTSGSHNTSIESLLLAFSQRGMKITTVPNIVPFLWHKFFINCAINPLTAFFRCRNGELISNTEYHSQLTSLCQELDQLLLAIDVDNISQSETGKPPRPSAEGKKESVISNEASKTDAITVLSMAEIVARETAANQSSMLTDVLENRPTELRYLNQYAQSIAAQNNCQCPLNDSLIAELIRRESAEDAT